MIKSGGLMKKVRPGGFLGREDCGSPSLADVLGIDPSLSPQSDRDASRRLDSSHSSERARTPPCLMYFSTYNNHE